MIAYIGNEEVMTNRVYLYACRETQRTGSWAPTLITISTRKIRLADDVIGGLIDKIIRLI